MANFEIDVKGFKDYKALAEIYPREAKRALVKSTNRALVHARKEITKEVRSEFKGKMPKSSDIKATMTLKKANYSNTTGVLESKGGRLRLGQFTHTKSKKLKKGRYRVPTVTIKSKKKLPNNFFTFDSKITGQNEVFRRIGKGKSGYLYGFSLSIPQMISNRDSTAGAYPRIRESTENQFQKELAHELQFQIGRSLEKMNGGAK